MDDYIYESPDRGETVYRRRHNTDHRELHYESKKVRSLHEDLMESKLWGDIRREAEKNPTLQAAIERVKVTYYLTEDYEKRYGNSKT